VRAGSIDTLAAAFLHDESDAMAGLRARLEAVGGAALLLERSVAAAPVVFRGRLFDVADEDGESAARAAVVVAMADEFGLIDDVAAFEAGAPFRCARLFACNPALGQRAIFEARLHPNERVAVHANVWSWLAAGGHGLLPLDWRWAALELKARGVKEIVAPSIDEAGEIERKLRAALKPPKIFVATSTVSEAA
jgi:hypothetical protein